MPAPRLSHQKRTTEEQLMDLRIRDKAAIVTGASRGIGRAITEQLAQEGVRILVVARDDAALAGAAQEISDRHKAVVTVHVADLSQPYAAADVVNAAVAALGGIDILVNCAGATKRGDFFSLTDDDWANGYALKFHGGVRMCRAAWPHLEERNGSIVNVVGIGPRTPSADFTIGGSVNSALINLTKALADLGRKRGVHVNAINPGYIETERLTRRIDGVVAEGKKSRDEVASELLQTLGIPRFGRPDEIGRLVAFLASPVSDYIQGATLDIDGGATKGI
jgi:NAD(P)-dependent dehydrogenase (short-subunit alcohol dehydrogenase family)